MSMWRGLARRTLGSPRLPMAGAAAVVRHAPLATGARFAAAPPPPAPPARRWKKGPVPRPPPIWDDPEEAASEAMMQFIDPFEQQPDLGAPGRRWRAAEIRLKSSEDLAKLWVVLLKERNMLHSTRLLHKQRQTDMPYPERMRAVQKSMAMIKVVLGERQREKLERDRRLHAEYVRDTALEQLDLAAAEVWRPWVPGSAREMAMAAKQTFDVVLRTHDGQPPPVRPPASALALTLTVDGEVVPPERLAMHVFLRPEVRSRPDELRYACELTPCGTTVRSERFLARGDDAHLVQPVELGPPVAAELSATLYGEAVGGEGGVAVSLLASKSTHRKVMMSHVDASMAQSMRANAVERAAQEDAAS